MDRKTVALSTCVRCKAPFDSYGLNVGYCSAECIAAGHGDRERHRRWMEKARLFVGVVVASSVILTGVVFNVRDYLVMASELQRINARVEHLRVTPLAGKMSSRDAFVAAMNGVSEVAYPSVASFCRALVLKGQAEQTVSDQDLPDKEAAIDFSVGASYLSSGDLVQVYNDKSTHCGNAQRFSARVSLVRDARSGASGWVLTRSLSANS